MVTDKETKVAKPVAYLYKGMTFGVSIGSFFFKTVMICKSSTYYTYIYIFAALDFVAGVGHRTQNEETIHSHCKGDNRTPQHRCRGINHSTFLSINIIVK